MLVKPLNSSTGLPLMAGKAGKAGKSYEYQGILKCGWNLIYLSCPLVEFIVTQNFVILELMGEFFYEW